MRASHSYLAAETWTPGFPWAHPALVNVSWGTSSARVDSCLNLVLLPGAVLDITGLYFVKFYVFYVLFGKTLYPVVLNRLVIVLCN